MPDIRLPTGDYQRAEAGGPDQTLVNLFAEEQPADLSQPVRLVSRPGHTSFATLTGGATPQGAYYSPGVFGSNVCAIASGNVYRVTSAGTVTNIGSVGDGSAPARFAATIGEFFCLVGGVVYQLTTGAVVALDFSSVFSQTIVDVAGINGRLVLLLEDGDFYWSEVLDGDNVLGLSFANAERNADGGVGCVVDKQELWLFGQRTIEPQIDTGQSAEFTFASISGAVIDRGCASRDTILREDNSIWWLGDDGVFYRAGGYTPQRMSRTEQEEAFRREIAAGNAQQIRCWAYTEDGHKFIAVRTPTNGCHVYDVATGEWARRQTGATSTYEPLTVFDGFSGPLALVPNAIVALDADEGQDITTPFAREVSVFVPARQSTAHFNLAVEGSPGATFSLQTSDDQGATFTDRGTKAAPFKWRSLGRVLPPGRLMKITSSSTGEVSITGARLNERDL